MSWIFAIHNNNKNNENNQETNRNEPTLGSSAAPPPTAVSHFLLLYQGTTNAFWFQPCSSHPVFRSAWCNANDTLCLACLSCLALYQICPGQRYKISYSVIHSFIPSQGKKGGCKRRIGSRPRTKRGFAFPGKNAIEIDRKIEMGSKGHGDWTVAVAGGGRKFRLPLGAAKYS
jgi:hypothetical protein